VQPLSLRRWHEGRVTVAAVLGKVASESFWSVTCRPRPTEKLEGVNSGLEHLPSLSQSVSKAFGLPGSGLGI
jgi:hypothetical protein